MPEEISLSSDIVRDNSIRIDTKVRIYKGYARVYAKHFIPSIEMSTWSTLNDCNSYVSLGFLMK